MLKYIFLILTFLPLSGILADSPADSLRQKKVNGIKVKLYKVQPKDSWSSISRKSKVSVAFLMTVNSGVDNLKPGQIINIPIEEVSQKKETADVPAEFHASPTVVAKESKYKVPVHHTVKKGETLFRISKFYNQPVEQLKSWNHLSKSELKVGQKLVVNYVYQYKKENVTASKNDQPAAIETTDHGRSSKETIPDVAATKVEKDPAVSKSDAIQSEKLLASTEKNPAAINDDRLTSTSVAKSNSGRMIRQMNETGVASWIMDGEVNQNKYYALHRYAPVGTIVKVTNRMNGKYVFVKVVGLLPDTGDNENLIIKISQAASNKINVLDSRFQAELSYGVAE